jgi:hypothetical protein
MSLLRTEARFDALAARLAARAGTLAEAHLAARLLADGRHWRHPGLLWPLFAKG